EWTRAVPPDTKAPPPLERENQRGDNRWRDRVAEARERVRQALREAAAPDRRPVLHRPRRDRKRRALAEADQHAAEEQRRESTGQPGEDRRASPDDAAEEQCPPRPEPVADPATENLKQQVGIAERGLQKTELR